MAQSRSSPSGQADEELFVTGVQRTDQPDSGGMFTVEDVAAALDVGGVAHADRDADGRLARTTATMQSSIASTFTLAG